MKLYQLVQQQKLNITIDQAWDFFSDPYNLQQITPSYLNLVIQNDAPPIMYQGMIILYQVKPYFNIPINWITEITHVDKLYFFVDEQRFGPYKFWHHKHFFTEIEEGILMEDRVHYSLYLDPLSRLINRYFVKPKLDSIFKYRYDVLNKLFNSE